ncbi:hypothetical protein LUQ84_002165 [Hamiltosporidium tvaerminnensis]|nr:hypothetical protein LUQ84_002165 [Hamiltosporidium tvaerminnensis]
MLETEDVKISWMNLNLKIKNKGLNTNQRSIIYNEFGSVGPKSMVALMGSSGAGKTSLMNSLAGRIEKHIAISGKIYVNSEERDPNTWPHIMAYVEQEFYFYENQTVEETVLFSSLMRLGGSETTDFIKNRTDEIINMLGLCQVKHTYINKVSGGEKKRVSIASELVGNPQIIFLDEPLSGLDSFSALRTLKILRELVNHGKTVLITIHQPSYQMLSIFDEMILMADGNIIFSGVVDDCIDFYSQCGFEIPEKTNPADFFLNIASVDTTTPETIEESNKRIEKLKEKWAQSRQEIQILNKSIKLIDGKRSSRFTFINLLKRNFLDLLRDKKYLKIQIIQKIIFLLLLGLTYINLGYSQDAIQSRVGVIFFILINSVFGTAGPLLNIFPKEKRIIQRERRSGMYDGVTAYLAKFIALIPFIIILTITYISAVYWMIGLYPSAGRFFIYLLIQASLLLFSIALTLTIGTYSPSENFSQVLGTTIIIIFIIFGGSFSNPNTIPSWLSWIIWISPIQYGFKASMQNQFDGLEFICNDNDPRCIESGNDVIILYGMESPSIWPCILTLWGLTVFWIFIGAIGLHFLTKISLKLK